MNNVCIAVSIIAIITITLFSALNTKGSENKNVDTIADIQLNEDIYIVNCVYDYRINSFRMFVYSPPEFPNAACLLEYENKKVKCTYNYKPYRIFGFAYGHLIIKNEETQFPKYITLNSTRIPVHIPYQGTAIYNLEFCICKFVNYTAVNRFIQTIESYRLFGVDHFTIYLVNASTSVMKVMRYYQSINIMEVVIGNNTFEFINFVNKQGNSHFAKEDDCIYRNMKRAKAVVMADMDEIIWPTKHKTLYEMLKSINGSYNYFTIRSYHFHTDVGSNTDVPDSDIFLFREYCRHKQGYIQKNIYTKLDAIYALFIHWIQDGTKELKQIHVPYELGYVRHTRRLPQLIKTSCETNWTIMAIDPREKVINENTKIIRNLLHIKPPLHIKPIILKDIHSPISGLLSYL